MLTNLDPAWVIGIIGSMIAFATFLNTYLRERSIKEQQHLAHEHAQVASTRITEESLRGAWEAVHEILRDIKRIEDQVRNLQLQQVGSAKEIEALQKTTDKAETAFKELVDLLAKMSVSQND